MSETAEHNMGVEGSLKQETTNGSARARALQALQQEPAPTTSIIEYVSQGRLVIIGPGEQAIPLAEQLLDQVRALAIIDPGPRGERPQLDDRIVYYHAGVDRIAGHLGNFQVYLQDRGVQELELKSLLGRSWPQIDIILDLLSQPIFDAEISPPGYFAARGDDQRLAEYLDTIPGLEGEFEKPRYFNYDPSICVHGRNGKHACNRCIDACPTLAIQSLGEQIEVDPYLCQGGGSCAAVCPSGAIQYRYPGLAEILGRIRRLLNTYREAHGEDARIVFIEEAQRAEWHRRLDGLDENLIPLALDELGAVDVAVMLNTLAYGAGQILIAPTTATPGRVRESLRQQQALAQQLLQGLGYSAGRIVIAEGDQLEEISEVSESRTPAATHAAFDEKRAMIHLALEHLYQHAPVQPTELALDEQAPFGQIEINPQTCTLCLACTGVCPTGALLAGNESPQVRFIEENCVQCGLCEQSCPEDAILRRQRYLFDSESRRARRVLYEEAPFHCVSCGKPFATQRMIAQMQDKLSGHWMFDNSRALRRLEMCEDCRVADMWDEQSA